MSDKLTPETKTNTLFSSCSKLSISPEPTVQITGSIEQSQYSRLGIKTHVQNNNENTKQYQIAHTRFCGPEYPHESR